MFLTRVRFGFNSALLLALLSLGAASIHPAAAADLPPSPPTHVLDEPGVLNPNVRTAVAALLAEHERITSEQFVVAIFNSLGEEDLVDYSSRIFQAWRIGKRGKDNGILLALYWNDRRARIEVGYGLEGLLTDARSKRVLEDFLIPELRARDPDRAISLSVLEVLDAVESPLIENGRAQEILRSGGMRGDFAPRTFQDAPQIRGWWIWIVAGFFVLFLAFQFITAAEAHFTRGGWYRPNPWQRVRRRSTWHSGWGGGFGGGGGGWGGGGGFSGGGGRSGGGGASGSW